MTSQNRKWRVGLVAMIWDMFHSIDYPSAGVHMITVMIGEELANVSRCGKFNRNFERTVADEVSNRHDASISNGLTS
jgi:hypothetical protein